MISVEQIYNKHIIMSQKMSIYHPVIPSLSEWPSSSDSLLPLLAFFVCSFPVV